MPTNFYMFFVAGLIPLIVGAVYYNDNVLGGAWKKVNGFSDSDLEGANMAVIFGLSYLFSVLMAAILSSLVIHQASVFGLFAPEVMESGSDLQNQFNELMGQFGSKYRTFSHGAVHGVILSVFFILPLLAINALFERRGWKYILIHFGYWLICLALMGGLLCQVLEYPPLS